MRPAADVLASQGVTLALEDGDLVSGAVVIARTVGEDGQVALTIGTSDGLSWIDQLGMLHAALDIARPDTYDTSDDEDDE